MLCSCLNAFLQIGQSPFRGRGSRGGRTFRRGGRGQFRYQGPPFRGRGRGRGGASRQIPAHSSAPTNSIVAYPPAADGATSVVQPSSPAPGQIPIPTPAQVPAAPAQPPPRKAWCEICKVECNTPEILEQHKNGKRHKKNSLVHEELQRLKAMHGQQSGQVPTSQLNSAVKPENIQELEKKPTENITSEVTTDNHKNETELQKDTGETSKVPAEEPDGKPGDNISAQGRGSKRKMRGGRGGKNARTNDGARRPVESPKPKQVPFICELCNVKCESQVVYDSHLAGKKHLSSLKRVHGLQAQNPPDINALSNSINSQVQQGVNDPQVLLAQLLMNYVMSQAQNPGIAPPLGSSGAPQIPGSSLTAGSGLETVPQGESENPTGETRNLSENAPAGSNTSTQTVIGSSESEAKVVNLPQNSPVVVPAENPSAANDQLPSIVS